LFFIILETLFIKHTLRLFNEIFIQYGFGSKYRDGLILLKTNLTFFELLINQFALVK